MTFSPGNQDRSADEVEHEVVFQTRFSIAATEVTQAQYELVMGENPSCNKGDDDSWRFLAR